MIIAKENKKMYVKKVHKFKLLCINLHLFPHFNSKKGWDKVSQPVPFTPNFYPFFIVFISYSLKMCFFGFPSLSPLSLLFPLLSYVTFFTPYPLLLSFVTFLLHPPLPPCHLSYPLSPLLSPVIIFLGN